MLGLDIIARVVAEIVADIFDPGTSPDPSIRVQAHATIGRHAVQRTRVGARIGPHMGRYPVPDIDLAYVVWRPRVNAVEGLD